MREHPILFSAPMVRAILAGTKTQTRRVARNLWDPPMERAMAPNCGIWRHADGQSEVLCPFGRRGDRLWVRETWAHPADDNGQACVVFRADGSARQAIFADEGDGDPCGLGAPTTATGINFWRPSIYMPRWASRISLEVTSVRVERLEEDADAEGCRSTRVPGANGIKWASARTVFHDLWGAINGKRAPWDSNPVVWVVSFKRVTA